MENIIVAMNVLKVVIKMKEIWKDIKYYEGLYKVSNKGRIKSFHGRKPKILKPQKDRYGYYGVHLCKDGTSCYYHIHRAVAWAFAPNRVVVNHIDGNHKNNCADNLEWVTASYNTKHAYEIGLKKPTIGIKNGNHVLNLSEVREIRKEYKELGTSIKNLADKWHISYQHMWRIINNKAWVV